MTWGKKLISQKTLSDTLTISHLVDGHWLHDDVAGMNLAIKAKTEEAAFVEAITYYQSRTARLDTELNELRAKVTSFLEQFKDTDEDESW